MRLLAKLLESTFPKEYNLQQIDILSTVIINSFNQKPLYMITQEMYNIAIDSYNLLLLTMKNSIPNKNECFNNINYFIYHIGYIKQADRCLTYCLEGNDELMRTMYAKDLSFLMNNRKIEDDSDEDLI